MNPSVNKFIILRKMSFFIKFVNVSFLKNCDTGIVPKGENINILSVTITHLQNVLSIDFKPIKYNLTPVLTKMKHISVTQLRLR